MEKKTEEYRQGERGIELKGQKRERKKSKGEQ